MCSSFFFLLLFYSFIHFIILFCLQNTFICLQIRLQIDDLSYLEVDSNDDASGDELGFHSSDSDLNGDDWCADYPNWEQSNLHKRRSFLKELGSNSSVGNWKPGWNTLMPFKRVSNQRLKHLAYFQMTNLDQVISFRKK
uniref:Uncharacterized protein n=1 Tax=Ditylenchus dipsaci TaxID=166011 RepID=A0A915DLD8_9BILA